LAATPNAVKEVDGGEYAVPPPTTEYAKLTKNWWKYCRDAVAPKEAAPEVTVLSHRSLDVDPEREAGTDQLVPESSHIEDAEPTNGIELPAPKEV